jgi:hypothetical protein
MNPEDAFFSMNKEWTGGVEEENRLTCESHPSMIKVWTEGHGPRGRRREMTVAGMIDRFCPENCRKVQSEVNEK